MCLVAFPTSPLGLAARYNDAPSVSAPVPWAAARSVCGFSAAYSPFRCPRPLVCAGLFGLVAE